MANSPAVIGLPSNKEVTEDTTSLFLTAVGFIPISDANSGQAFFKTTVKKATGTLGTLTLAADGTYTYSVANSAVQYLGAGKTKVETFTVTSVDGTAKQISFTIKGTNDAAVIGNPALTPVTEDVGVFGGNLKVTGTLSISDADQGEASFKTTVTSVGTNLGALTIAANGSYTYSVSNAATQSLGAGDTKTETFIVTALDGTTKQISFTIQGKNDVAMIGTPTVRNTTDTGGSSLTATGMISVSDVDHGQAAFNTTVAQGANLGTLSLNANGSYTYSVAKTAVGYLGAGATKTETFTITSVDGTSKQVSFVITGINDAAVIGAPTFSNVTEDATQPILYAFGSISIADADAGEASFKVALISGQGALGTLVVLPNGSYTYFVAGSAVQYLGAGDTKIDTFTITAKDGTTKEVSFTIHGTNDAAVIGTPTNRDVTADPSQTTLTATGSISISDVDQNQASFNTTVVSAAGNIGSLVLGSNGTYTYSVPESAAEQLGIGGTKVDTFTVTAFDGTTRQVTFVVHGAASANHPAVIGNPSVSSVTEDATTPDLAATGTISISDADGAGEAAFQASVTSAPGNLGSLSLSSNGSYTYTVSNGLTQYLGAGDTKVDTFTVTSLDGTTKQVTFTINGSNDAAVIGTPAIVDVTENGNLSLSGTLSVTDVDQDQDSFQTTVTAVGTVLGSLSLDANGAYTYSVLASATQSLGDGVTRIDTFTIKSLDGTTQQISFTIHGVNDAAVIGTPAIVDVIEDAGVVAGNLSLSGTLEISDADQGEGSFETTVAPGLGNLGTLTLAANGAYTYSVANSATQSMGAGVTRTDTFTVTSLDGTSKQLSFTIHGSNDAAVIGTPGIVDVTEDATAGIHSLSGILSISDADTGQASFQAGSTAAGGNLGTLIFDTDGSYTYSVANSATQSVGPNATHVDTFTVTSVDGTPQQISFNIQGTQDAPTLSVATASGAEDNSIPLSISSALIDSGSDLSLTITGVPAGTTFNHGMVDANDPSVWHLSGSDLSGLALTPASNFSGSINLSVMATSTDTVANSQLSSAVQTLTVNIVAVADAPTLTGPSTIGAVASTAAIPLNLSVALVDASETLGAVAISGVTGGYVLSAGVHNDDGDYWLVPADQLAGLKMQPGTAGTAGASGEFHLHVTARSIDGTDVATKSIDVTVNVAPDPDSFSSRVVDGYILGATVFSDDDGDGQQDAGEAWATTAADGTFTITGAGGGKLVMFGGTDVSTGLAFHGTLSAVAGSTVITPLTTLVAALATSSSPAAIAIAQTAVLNAFGLGTVDLQTFDPVAAAAEGGTGAAAATKILAAGIQVQTTIAQITAAAGSDTTGANVVSALATAISGAAGGTVNLANTATLTSIINNAAPEADPAAVSAATLVVSAANTAIATAAAGVGDPLAVLTGLAQAATVALGQGTEQLAAAAAGTNGATFAEAVANNTGSALTTAIQTVEVGDPDGSEVGTLGNDTISGAGGNDVIDGLDGNDTLSGLGGKDTIRGGNGNDKIFGGEGDDRLYGDEGRDLLTGGAGDDIIDGGNNFDRASYVDATGGVSINLLAGTASGAGIGSDTLTRIEGVVGSDHADTFDGTDFVGSSGLPGSSMGQNDFEGGGGDDIIIGTLNALGQKVTRANYLAATGAVTADLALGIADGDASVGHDTLTNISTLWGSAHNDTLRGSDNGPGTYETYEGRAGDDLIDGRGGYDQVTYNNDPNTTSGVDIRLAAGTVTGDASVGTDTLRAVEAARGTNFDDRFDATNFGGAGAVNIGSSGTFNDFAGAGGDDQIIGNGATRVSYSLAGAAVSVYLETSAPGATALTVAGYSTGATEGTDTFTGVNAVQGSVFDDTFVGSSFNNTFTGLGGDDSIDGRGGFDTASYNSLGLVTAGVSINMTTGVVVGDASVGTDTLRSIEGVQGTGYADTYTATNFGAAGFQNPATNNVGNNGTFNQFEGLGGNDIITGNGNTRLLYTNATAGVTIVFTGSGAGTADGNPTVGHDEFTLVNSITGSAFGDSITGDGTNNVFDGGAGGDTINGGGGSDTITGGAGNDTIDGGSGFADMAVYTAAFPTYTLNLTGAGTGTISGADGTDSFTGVELLQFSARYSLVASGSAGSSINVTGLNFNAGLAVIASTGSNDDFLTIGQQLSNRLIDLGAGSGDTITLGVAGGYNLNLANVENLMGTGGDDNVSMVANANGLAIDLGAGINDQVNLAIGANTLSAVNVENINSNDFAAASNDTLTLTNNVSGLTINLGSGTNTINLAAGTNSLVNAFGTNIINGTSSSDTLTVNGLFQSTVNLGDGIDSLFLINAFNTLGLSGVENVFGGTADDFVNLQNNVSGVTFNLGNGSNDTVTLATGVNSVGAVGVENINNNDFGGSPSNDTLTLLNNVIGLSINLGQGTDTINLAAGVNSLNNVFGNTIINGTASGDTLTLVNGINGSTIDLGDGIDTLNLTNPAGFNTLGLSGVENVIGGTADDYVVLQNSVAGVTFDLGMGSDTLVVANGSNSVGVAGVEFINGTDFGGSPSNDTLTLLSNVNGIQINLGDGSNTLNLAAGMNSVKGYGLQTINGTTSDDELTTLENAAGSTIDLGAGTDTLNLGVIATGVTVKDIENVNGSTFNDTITIANNSGTTTVTGGTGSDTITAGAGQDNIRYTNALEAAVGGGETVNNFNADNDTLVLDHVGGLAGQIHFVGNGVFTGSPGDFHSEARLIGNVLQIDVDGDGQIGAGDMEITLSGLTGTLTDANFVTSGVNHAPSDISLVGSSVAESAIAGTVVGALSGSDPDAGDTATFSIVNSNGMFAINGNNLVVAGPIDYEAGTSQQVTVRVTDAGGASYDEMFIIGITDANDAPTVNSGATGSVAENAATSTVVYQATASDPDATAPNNAITWSLSGMDAAAFSIDAGGNVTLNNSANYEAKSSYSINVVATDGGTLFDSKAVTISVTDANDAPTVTSGATASVAENEATSTVVYQATASDPDATAPNNAITWSLGGMDAAAFSIDAGGNVTLNGSADYEAKNSYLINVVATDGGNLSSIKAVTVNVSDVNEGPTVTSGAAASVAENAATSTVVYQAIASDPDTGAPNDTITWSLSGTDAGAFSIDTNGQVRLNSSANFELRNSYSLNVIATDGGTLSSTKAVTVSVTDANEAPTDISVSNAAVPQSTASGTVVGALSAIDPDAGDTAAFSMVDGNGGQFDVVGGNIIVAGPLTAGAQQVIVRVTDALGLTYDETITINVNAGGTFVGDANSNALTGTSGDDLMQSLAGNDRLQGLDGNDTLDGGLDFDRAVYSDATGGITANLAAGTVSGPGVGSDTLVDVEGIVGSAFADTLNAAGFSGDTGIASISIGFNEIEGGGGDDTITSAVNSQGALLTKISYVNAVSSVTVDLIAHTATGGDGNDTLVGSGFANVVGSGHADQLLGSSNAGGTVEVFEGRAGNDTINGRAGFDRADYSQDTATTVGILVDMLAGTVTGDATVGTDTLISVESVRGTKFADTYTATGFNGGGVNPGSNGTFNEFNGMGGNDTINGNGATRITYINATGGVVVDLQTGGTAGTGTASGDASTGIDTFSGVNAIQASMFGDTLRGSSNNDNIAGLGGNDFIDGRGGFDTAIYNNIYFSTGAVTIDFAAGTATGDASIGNDTLRAIEGVQGTNFNDTFVATGFGIAGALNVGNSGNFNQFEGIGGNDTITGNGNTRIIYGSATDAVTINLQAGTASGGNSVGNDTYVGVNSATGSSLNDTYDAAGFTGVTSAGSFGTFNLFEGLAGADTITGNGNTRVSYSQASGGGVNVNLLNGVVSGAAGADVIMGGVNSVQGSNQSDTLTGGTGDESFFGGGGVDTINAGDGNDGISGQGGSDNIDGGAGTDVAFFTGGQGQYTITTPGAVVVQNNSANGDGTDTLTNVEVLNFSDAILLQSSGTSVNPIDISGQQLSGSGAVTGAGGDDFLMVGGSINGRQINLGLGTDTVIVINGGATLNLGGVENLKGTAGNEMIFLNTIATGLNIDLGGGTDSLFLANGSNSVSITSSVDLFSNDFGSTVSNDTLTLLNNVSGGVSVHMANGDNTLILAGGTNSLIGVSDTHHIHGSASNDVLSITGSLGNVSGTTTVDLGDGDDTLNVNMAHTPIGLVGVEHLNGNSQDNVLTLLNNASGVVVNLGDGNDTLQLANGINSLSAIGIENLNGSDFGGTPSNDTLTLLNTVSGLNVHLADGSNTLNVAAGNNTLGNLFGVNFVNGSASNDTLTITGQSGGTFNLGDGTDTVTFNTNVFNTTVLNAENIVGSSNFDQITIGNTSGNTTITAGGGADWVTASAGDDNFRFTSVSDAAAGAADTVYSFDADNDSFTFSGINVSGGHIEYVDSAAFLGGGQASAHLQNFGAGNDLLQIDTNGDGTADMDISLQNYTGTLTSSNFLL